MPYPISRTTGVAYQTIELGHGSRTTPEDHVDRTTANPVQHNVQPDTNSRGQNIVWTTFFLTFPLLLLTCILFAFVFAYRVDINHEPSSLISNSSHNPSFQPDKNAYYVDLSSTMLIFVASWMSSLAPMLTGFAIALAAYPVAEKLLDDTDKRDKDRLLTPFQLQLALRLLDGAVWSSIWNLLLYRLGWGKRTKSQGAALTSLFRVTSIVVFLSILVFAADTWLHLVTKTVNVTQITSINLDDVHYSLLLNSPNCTSTNNTMVALSEAGLSCSLDPESGSILDGVPAFFTLNNQSNELSVLSDGPDSRLAYLTVTPSERNPQLDFSAHTFGIRSTCHPITTSCNANGTGSQGTWSCGNGGFSYNSSSTYTGPPYDVDGYFDDEAMTNYILGGGDVNPFYYFISAATQLNAMQNSNLRSDPEFQVVTTPSHASISGAILSCAVGVYEVDYTVLQGNVTYMESHIANASVANLVVTALATGGFGESNIGNAFDLATYISNSAQELADNFALAYSKIALSIAASSVTRAPVSAAESESTLLLAKVPKAPLFLLIVVNLIFVVMGIILAILAARTSPEAFEILSRFSVAGIVAGMFEKRRSAKTAGAVEKFYEEYCQGTTTKRVGVARCNDGGFRFKVLEKEIDIGISTIVHLHQKGWNKHKTTHQDSEVWM